MMSEISRSRIYIRSYFSRNCNTFRAHWSEATAAAASRERKKFNEGETREREFHNARYLLLDVLSHLESLKIREL